MIINRHELFVFDSEGATYPRYAIIVNNGSDTLIKRARSNPDRYGVEIVSVEQLPPDLLAFIEKKYPPPR